MDFSFDLIEDKIEFFESTSLKTLEQEVQKQIDINKAIMLQVASVSHQMHVGEHGDRLYSAVVHFKQKKA
ncbi:DUF2536 family protein [Bacillus testis]|uniref:DUF2536 family protein n=1 Tax=Bacillus testis TaxID=1622072 RepID=UPI00067F24D5|nr:DUF2536 family protein [Bacillus testis]